MQELNSVVHADFIDPSCIDIPVGFRYRENVFGLPILRAIFIECWSFLECRENFRLLEY